MRTGNKQKKLGVLFIALCMVLCSLCITGEAEEVKASTTNNINLQTWPTPSNTDNNDGWIWNADGKILTLYGVDVGTISVPGGTTIELVGYNKINDITCAGILNITGSGVLDATVIYAGAAINISGGYINLKSSTQVPIRCSGGDVNISGGYINIDTTNSVCSYAIQAGGKTDKDYYTYKQTGGYVSIKCKDGQTGVYAKYFDMSGGFLDIKGGSREDSSSVGIYGKTSVTNSGGVITIENVATGIPNAFTCTGGVTKIKATSKALDSWLYCNNGERYWTGETPAGAGIEVDEYGDCPDAKEILIAKSLEIPTASDNVVTLDGIYYTGDAVTVGGTSADVSITGGNYFGSCVTFSGDMNGNGTVVSTDGIKLNKADTNAQNIFIRNSDKNKYMQLIGIAGETCTSGIGMGNAYVGYPDSQEIVSRLYKIKRSDYIDIIGISDKENGKGIVCGYDGAKSAFVQGNSAMGIATGTNGIGVEIYHDSSIYTTYVTGYAGENALYAGNLEWPTANNSSTYVNMSTSNGHYAVSGTETKIYLGGRLGMYSAAGTSVYNGTAGWSNAVVEKSSSTLGSSYTESTFYVNSKVVYASHLQLMKLEDLSNTEEYLSGDSYGREKLKWDFYFPGESFGTEIVNEQGNYEDTFSEEFTSTVAFTGVRLRDEFISKLKSQDSDALNVVKGWINLPDGMTINSVTYEYNREYNVDTITYTFGGVTTRDDESSYLGINVNRNDYKFTWDATYLSIAQSMEENAYSNNRVEFAGKWIRSIEIDVNSDFDSELISGIPDDVDADDWWIDTYAGKIQLPTLSARGYEFLGWYDGQGSDANKVTDATVFSGWNNTVYAKWQPCSHQGTLVEHKETEATCTEPGAKTYWECSACGGIYSDSTGTTPFDTEDITIDALGHDMKHIEAKDATCTEDGVKEHYECSRCGKCYSDEEGQTEVTKESVTLKALGHDYVDGICSRCGAIEPGEVSSDTDPEKNAANADLKDLPDNILDILGGTDKEKAESVITAGKDVSIYLDVKDAKDTVTTQDKTKVEAALEEKDKIGMYLDINLLMKAGDENPSKISNTSKDMTITIKVPDSLIVNSADVERTYFIIRVHDGQVDKIYGTYDKDNNAYTFKTDRFSTYALAYSDEIAPEHEHADSDNDGKCDDCGQDVVIGQESSGSGDSTGTGDATHTAVWFILIMLSGLGLVLLYSKKCKCGR